MTKVRIYFVGVVDVDVEDEVTPTVMESLFNAPAPVRDAWYDTVTDEDVLEAATFDHYEVIEEEKESEIFDLISYEKGLYEGYGEGYSDGYAVGRDSAT